MQQIQRVVVVVPVSGQEQKQPSVGVMVCVFENFSVLVMHRPITFGTLHFVGQSPGVVPAKLCPLSAEQ